MSTRLSEKNVDEFLAEVGGGWERLGPYLSGSAPLLCRHLPCGRSSSVRIDNLRAARRRGGTGCQTCKGRKLAYSEDEALSILAEAQFIPLEPYPGLQFPWRMKHVPCGAEVTPMLRSLLRRKNTGCRSCATADLSLSLRKSHDEAVSQVAKLGLRPRDGALYPGPTFVWALECTVCGGRVDATYNQATKKSQPWGCQGCKARRRVAEIAARVAQYGWTVIEASGRQWRMQHRCGHITHLSPSAPGRYGEGCAECASSGFKPQKSAYVYLIRLPSRSELKVGITSALSVRLASYRSQYGVIEVLRTIGPMPGASAKQIEDDMLAAWEAEEFLDGKREYIRDVPRAVGVMDMVLYLHQTSTTVFDPADCEVRSCSRKDARSFLECHHYLGSLPTSPIIMGLYTKELLAGVAVYGTPTRQNTAKALWGGDKSNTLELQRFALAGWLKGQVASWFLSRSIKALPKTCEVVVSYADPGQGHVGTIYQATNFIYTGDTSPSYHYLTPFGEMVHKKTLYNQAIRNGVKEKEEADREGYVKVWEPPKHRYAFARTRSARRKLQERALPFP